jgi:hypothetical protein
MAITKNTTRVYQIFKDESATHTALPPLVVPDFLFAFDEDVELAGVFVDPTTSDVDGLEVFSDDTSYSMDDYSFETITYKGQPYEFKIFGFTGI